MSSRLFGLRALQRRAVDAVVETKQQVALFHVAPVLERYLLDGAGHLWAHLYRVHSHQPAGEFVPVVHFPGEGGGHLHFGRFRRLGRFFPAGAQ